MRTISVDLGERGYPIHIGAGLLGDPLQEMLGDAVVGDEVALISNDVVFDLYGEAVINALANNRVDVFKMRDGEAHKSLESYAQAQAFLLEKRHSRATTVIALGGGVVGDLAGFVAATYQRGVRFVQLPTTLLAQVDSSVGGKTAINHALGKNMIGAFYQPSLVVIDTDVLATLPAREYAAGLAEVVKYGVIADAEFFAWLETNDAPLAARDGEALAKAIARSCEIKAEVVVADEREGGLRAILNFGHTFGHAIESLAGYGTLLHGEAVAVGMVMASQLSEGLALAPQGSAGRVRDLLARFDLPTDLSGPGVAIDRQEMMEAMAMDKKAVSGDMRFVVTPGIGRAHVASLDDGRQRAALTSVLDAFGATVG